ncbi:unnamed protein product, partial [Amoebophrya sp. A120]|eukprot:GSA120T00025170001.1
MRFRRQLLLLFSNCLRALETEIRAEAVASGQLAGTRAVLPPSAFATAKPHHSSGRHFLATVRDAILQKTCSRRRRPKQDKVEGAVGGPVAERGGEERRTELRQRTVGPEQRNAGHSCSESRDSQAGNTSKPGCSTGGRKWSRTAPATSFVSMIPGPETSEIFSTSSKSHDFSTSSEATQPVEGADGDAVMPRTEKTVANEGTRDSSSGDLVACPRTMMGQKGRKASNPVSNTGLLGQPTLRERGLLLSGNSTRTSLLHEKDGILSFLSPKEAVAVLQTSKKHTDDVEQEDRGAPSTSNASENNSVKAAAWEQYRHDSKLENRAESCEDLWLEVLRERVGTKKPRDYWNPQVDGHSDFLAKFQCRLDSPRRRKQTAGETDWSVLLLMSMAAETCSPLRSYSTSENETAILQDRYASENLQKGCHAGDRDFFREVLDFFHAEVSRSDRTSEKGKHVVIWNPPQETNGFNGTLAARAIASNPNRGLLDSRCRLAMATELLFQRHAVVYDTPFFFVKHG